MAKSFDRSVFENFAETAQSELWAIHGSLFRTFNSSSFNFNSGHYVNAVRAIVCFELPAREASSLCRFLKIDLNSFDLSSHLSPFDTSKLVFFGCLLRINLPNLCPTFDSFWCLGFQWVTLWRSDKYLLTLSVYSESDVLYQSSPIHLKQDGGDWVKIDIRIVKNNILA